MSTRSYDHFPPSHVHYPEILPGVEFLLAPGGMGAWQVTIEGYVEFEGERVHVLERLSYRRHREGRLGALVGLAIRGQELACRELAEHLISVSLAKKGSGDGTD